MSSRLASPRRPEPRSETCTQVVETRMTDSTLFSFRCQGRLPGPMSWLMTLRLFEIKMTLPFGFKGPIGSARCVSSYPHGVWQTLVGK